MRPVIDLTTDDDLPPPPLEGKLSKVAVGLGVDVPSSQPGALSGRRRFCEQPPLKRRCLDESPLSFKPCVQEHILPHVIQAAGCLERDKYVVNDVAMQTIAAVSRSSKSRSSKSRIATDEVNAQTRPLRPSEAAVVAVDAVEKSETSPVGSPGAREHDVPLTRAARKIPQTQLPTTAPLTKIAETRPWPGLAKRAREPNVASPPPTAGAPACYSLRSLYSVRRHRQSQATAADQAPRPKRLCLATRPYLPASDRELIAKGVRNAMKRLDSTPQWPVVYHVDFTADEVFQIFTCLTGHLSIHPSPTMSSLAALCRQHKVASIVSGALRGRTSEDVHHFCSDLMRGLAAAPDRGRVLSLDEDQHGQVRERRRAGRMSSLLLAREMEGNAGFGRMRQYANFQDELETTLQDDMTVVAEYTDCAGDITAMSWVPDGNVLCGTTAHSDSHNQQYNKPGNLVLCSSSQGTLRAFADHRIPRPKVDMGENSSEAMRRSQDPWVYASVVSSDYDAVRGLGYTSSFDRTVKVWDVSKDGASMKCVATWHHGGNVNFVAAARDGSGCVASAADVPSEAIRVYTIRKDDMDQSPYVSLSCTRTDTDGSDRWTYWPSTMQWGRAPGTTHLLLVGYSPRGLVDDDRDIPDDKKHTGEIMLWDAARGCRVPILAATAVNVFEAVWHPQLQRFIAATSPNGVLEQGVRTQIHVFQLDGERQDGAYSEFQKLDCFAADINELTIMPNSLVHAYVTAGCTDGKVYVWDTGRGDHPIHILQHGDPIDDFSYDREKEDTGVKFTAWGRTADRLYTGSSDGVVKVWNVRNAERPFVRDLLEAPGPISVGAFSPDHAKLAIGDATGRVFMLSVDSRDAHETHFTTLPGSSRRLRCARPLTPHPEPAPPSEDESEAEADACPSRSYLDSRQLVLHSNPVVGAVKGPEYESTSLFWREAHLDEEPGGPLLLKHEREQQESLHASRGPRQCAERRLRNPFSLPDAEAAAGGWEQQHAANLRRDLDSLLKQTDFADLWRALRLDGALLSDYEEDWGLAYEELPASLDEL